MTEIELLDWTEEERREVLDQVFVRAKAKGFPEGPVDLPKILAEVAFEFVLNKIMRQLAILAVLQPALWPHLEERGEK